MKDDVNYVTFNQDASCVALGLSSGYKVFSCRPSFAKCFSTATKESVGLISMLYKTSLIAEVALGEEPGQSPRKLKIVNTKLKCTICDLLFPTSILKVILTRDRMVVLLEDQIYIYDITSMKLLHTIETSPNPTGTCSVSFEPAHDEGLSLTAAATVVGGGSRGGQFLAYPSPPKTITHDSLLAAGINTNGGQNSVQNNIQSVSNSPNRVGDVIIFNLATLQPVSVIEAHKAALASMALSTDGCFLATASEKGTIVRVFDVATGSKLFQFRRGTYPTKIHSLRFSQDNRYVLATSSSGTVHIFRCGDEESLATKQARKKQLSSARKGPKPMAIPEEEPTLPESFVGSPTTSISNVTVTATNKSTPSVNEEYFDDLGDQSDSDEEFEQIEVTKHRKLSSGSANSATSHGMIPTTSNDDRSEPVVDQNRLSVARLIRHSSQTLGRKAAQKMGDFLPSSFSSILEPTRHFASIKIPSAGKDTKSIASLHPEVSQDVVPQSYVNAKEAGDDEDRAPSINSSEMTTMNLLHVHVVTSEGVFYVYGLDPERGGDCILLHQHSMVGKE
ncbi:autophagy-related protein 18 [Diutina catenulata]